MEPRRKKKTKLIKTNWWLGGGVWGAVEGGQKVQISRYKMNKFWGYKMQHGDFS